MPSWQIFMAAAVGVAYIIIHATWQIGNTEALAGCRALATLREETARAAKARASSTARCASMINSLIH